MLLAAVATSPTKFTHQIVSSLRVESSVAADDSSSRLHHKLVRDPLLYDSQRPPQCRGDAIARQIAVTSRPAEETFCRPDRRMAQIEGAWIAFPPRSRAAFTTFGAFA